MNVCKNCLHCKSGGFCEENSGIYAVFVDETDRACERFEDVEGW